MSTAGADRRDGYWFGTFDGPCKSVPLPLCQLVGFPAGQGSTPAVCYNRNTDVFGQIVLLPSTVAVYLISFIMFVIIIWHVKSKYTAVGRKEMVIFFYLCLVTFFVEFLLTTGAVVGASAAYTHLTAAHVGLISATFLCLLVNGLISFQIIEDGTPKSVWLVRLSAAFIFAVTYLVAIDTFSGILRIFDRANPTGLWVMYFVLNGGFLAIYIVLQIFLVLRMLDSRWPLGDVLIAVTFFVISYLVLFGFGTEICEYTDHYVDGLFFGTLLNLLAILMVYKYWDSITSEDLEFAVDSDGRNWEVREDDDCALLACEMHQDAALYLDEAVAAARSPHLSFVVGGGGARTAASSVYAPDHPFATPPPFAATDSLGITVPAYGADGFPAPFVAGGFEQQQQQRQQSAPGAPTGGGGGWRPVPPSLRSARSFTSAHSPSPRSAQSPTLRSARSPSLRSPGAYALLFSPSPAPRADPDDHDLYLPGHHRAPPAPAEQHWPKELPASPRSKALPPKPPASL